MQVMHELEPREARATVGYLVNLYPAVSHTFIRREILALERQGFQVVRIALHGDTGALPDQLDVSERARTRYVLAGGMKGLLAALLHATVTSPKNVLKAVGLALQMARGSDRAWPRHLAYVAEACQIKRWVDDRGVQHLHAHFATNSAEIAMLVHRLGGPPYSFTAHGSDINDRPAQMGLPLIVGNAEFVVAVSAYGRSQICKWVSEADWPRIHVIRCGLDADYRSEIEPEPAPPSRRMVCVGRLSKEKGQIVLVEAVRLLRDKGIQVEVALVGEGPMRDAISGRIAELGLGQQIRLLGAQDADGVRAQMLAARALVVPSLSEGLPVVIMEAMALRRPVIAPYLAGIPELVRDGLNGWLYPAADVDALARAMRLCLEVEADVLVSMGRAAQLVVQEAHDIDREVTRLGACFLESVAASEA